MINILLAEDHNIMRNGIRMLLESDALIHVAAEAVNGTQALTHLSKHPVDLVITDINMPERDGIELLQEIKATYPEVRVIILSTHDQEKNIIEAFKNNADGYLLKNIAADELIFAIKSVYNGHKYLCAELVMNLVKKWINGKHCLMTTTENTIDFSLRELEIMQLIADGLTNLEMSEKLFLSKRTIEGHRQSLLDKTGAKNSAALIRYGILHGIIN